MYNRLLTYLENNDIIFCGQHGFRSGLSTITAATQFIESVVESVDKHEKVIGISMDMSKAFDRVHHQILLSKLKDMGIEGSEWLWFQSYLSDRQQYVNISHIKSQWLLNTRSTSKMCRFGVPQGSILGPLLFLCYINGIPGAMSHVPTENMWLYADDTSLKISGDSLEDIEIKSYLDLSNIQQFLSLHNLELNLDKTNFISFSTKQSKEKIEPNIKIDNQELEQLDEITFLGLIVDKHLMWDKHVEKICSKVNSGLYALSKMSYLCNIPTLKSIYFSYIHSHISYGISLYGSTSKQNLTKILRLQKKALRIILRLKKKDSVKNQFKQLGILTVFGMYILQTIIFVKEYMPEKTSKDKHAYNTRGRAFVETQRHNLELAKKKTSLTGLAFWRMLPTSIRHEGSNTIFKRKLKKYLVDISPYSTDEVFQTLK